jgi:zinc transporter 1
MHQLLAFIGTYTSLHSFAGVPTTISLEDVRAAILDVPGVLSVHELHVWQLSEAKVVASVHIAAPRQVDFMVVAGQVREKLHHHGIHSCTIQPEYHQSNSPPDETLMVRARSKVSTCSV